MKDITKCVRKSSIVFLSMSSFTLGLIYVIAGVISLINWLSSWFNLKYEFLPKTIPPDPWLSIVLITVGLVMLSTPYYLMRNNVMMTVATLLIGAGLAVSVMGIQIIATLSTLIDNLISGEVISTQVLILNLLRIDALLGYASLPIFMASILLFRLMRIKGLFGLTLNIK